MLPPSTDQTTVHAYLAADDSQDPAGSDGHHVTDTSTGDEGNKLPLLWIPYVILTCVIVGLMAASFMRFHKKNGHKYQRRRMELLRQVNMQKILNQIPDQLTHPGQLLPGQLLPSHLPANGGTVGASIPSRTDPERTTTTGNNSQRRSSTKSSKSSKSNKSNHPHNPNANHNSISSSSGGNGNRTAKRHTRPLMFTHNSNGSMVDLRCVNRECDVKSPFQGPATCPPHRDEAPLPFGPPVGLPPASSSVIQTPLTTTRPPPLSSRGSRGSYSVPHGGEAYGSSSGSYNGGTYGGSYSGPLGGSSTRSRDSVQYATPYAVHLPDTISEDQRLLIYQNQSKV